MSVRPHMEEAHNGCLRVVKPVAEGADGGTDGGSAGGGGGGAKKLLTSAERTAAAVAAVQAAEAVTAGRRAIEYCSPRHHNHIVHLQ